MWLLTNPEVISIWALAIRPLQFDKWKVGDVNSDYSLLQLLIYLMGFKLGNPYHFS